MREIVLDTETTGLDPNSGDRIVEIGCIELINHIPSGRTYHQYINPERDMPVEAYNVHGLSTDFLMSYPIFSAIVDTFLEFIDDGLLIIHNADFDMGFINAELVKLNLKKLNMDRSLDTVRLARQKFPGAPANLDALCRRFNIDNSNRQMHGALLDARLLADVYLELNGGRQTDLGLTGALALNDAASSHQKSIIRPPRHHSVSPEDEARHKAFIETLNDALWLKNSLLTVK
jgi:DNA polymerase-3 subunit epsilon